MVMQKVLFTTEQPGQRRQSTAAIFHLAINTDKHILLSHNYSREINGRYYPAMWFIVKLVD